MKKLSLFLSIGSVVLFAQEQQRTITGVIKDFETRQAVVFCDVIQENSNNNTISDKDGNFIITIDWNKENTSLIFQTEEYETDTLQLDSVQNHYTVYLYPKSVNFDEIVITGTTRATLLRENPVPIIPVSSKQIERTAGSNMIDVLVKNVPGLTAVKTGTNISKPFIRGLGYNRVLTLYD